MWFRRRRRQPPPVLLPSLDRLAELVERVVALLDQLSLAPVPEPRAELVLEQHKPEPADGWLAFIPSPEGYRLLERDGSPPVQGETVELDGRYCVLRLGPSPLPRDRRRCAYVERKEPPSAERSFER